MGQSGSSLTSSSTPASSTSSSSTGVSSSSSATTGASTVGSAVSVVRTAEKHHGLAGSPGSKATAPPTQSSMVAVGAPNAPKGRTEAKEGSGSIESGSTALRAPSRPSTPKGGASGVMTSSQSPNVSTAAASAVSELILPPLNDSEEKKSPRTPEDAWRPAGSPRRPLLGVERLEVEEKGPKPHRRMISRAKNFLQQTVKKIGEKVKTKVDQRRERRRLKEQNNQAAPPAPGGSRKGKISAWWRRRFQRQRKLSLSGVVEPDVPPSYTVRVNICQGRVLENIMTDYAPAPGNDRGNPIVRFKRGDAFLIARLDGQVQRTKPAKSILAPVWNEQLVFMAKDRPGPLQLLFSTRHILRNHDIGTTSIPLEPFIDLPPQPAEHVEWKWITLYCKRPEIAATAAGGPGVEMVAPVPAPVRQASGGNEDLIPCAEVQIQVIVERGVSAEVFESFDFSHLLQISICEARLLTSLLLSKIKRPRKNLGSLRVYAEMMYEGTLYRTASVPISMLCSNGESGPVTIADTNTDEDRTVQSFWDQDCFIWLQPHLFQNNRKLAISVWEETTQTRLGIVYFDMNLALPDDILDELKRHAADTSAGQTLPTENDRTSRRQMEPDSRVDTHGGEMETCTFLNLTVIPTPAAPYARVDVRITVVTAPKPRTLLADSSRSTVSDSAAVGAEEKEVSDTRGLRGDYDFESIFEDPSVSESDESEGGSGSSLDMMSKFPSTGSESPQPISLSGAASEGVKSASVAATESPTVSAGTPTRSPQMQIEGIDGERRAIEIGVVPAPFTLEGPKSKMDDIYSDDELLGGSVEPFRRRSLPGVSSRGSSSNRFLQPLHHQIPHSWLYGALDDDEAKLPKSASPRDTTADWDASEHRSGLPKSGSCGSLASLDREQPAGGPVNEMGRLVGAPKTSVVDQRAWALSPRSAGRRSSLKRGQVREREVWLQVSPSQAPVYLDRDLKQVAKKDMTSLLFLTGPSLRNLEVKDDPNTGVLAPESKALPELVEEAPEEKEKNVVASKVDGVVEPLLSKSQVDGLQLRIRVKVVPRPALEYQFCTELMSEFGTSRPGFVTHLEVQVMLEALDLDEISPQQTQELFRLINPRFPGVLDDEEFREFLRLVWSRSFANALKLLTHVKGTASLFSVSKRPLTTGGGGESSSGASSASVTEPPLASGERSGGERQHPLLGEKSSASSMGVIGPASSEDVESSMMEHKIKSELILQDRASGLFVREVIPGWLRALMKAQYQSRFGRFVTGMNRTKRLCKKLSLDHGRKYDSPESVKSILPFVRLHNLDLSEVAKDVSEFKTFNEFFYRKLKPDARPVPPEPEKVLSPADCRIVVFESVVESTRLWIKGQNFTVENLLGPELAKEVAPRYKNGSVVVARLAPQDYHRWHCPVSGTLGRRVKISGDYNSVNPLAVNTAVDVFTSNKREVCEIDSELHGKMLLLPVGAALVGGIHVTVQHDMNPPHSIRRGDEHGYFSFGGSTIILLFEPGKVIYDRDLVLNSQKGIETIVKCNSSIGRSPPR